MLKILFILAAAPLLAVAHNITATKAYVDKQDALRREKTDMRVYAYDWDYSAISNIVPGVYFIDTEKKIDPWHPSTPLYQWTGGTWDEVGYGDATATKYRITTAISSHKALVGVVVTNGVLGATGDTLATVGGVTNAARSVINSYWDEARGVTWQAKMVDGNLYYIAVTNTNLEAAQ